MDAAEAARLLIEQRRMRERFEAEQSADAGRHSAAELRASGGRLAPQARTAWVVSDSLPAPCSLSGPSELAQITSLDVQDRKAVKHGCYGYCTPFHSGTLIQALSSSLVSRSVCTEC